MVRLKRISFQGLMEEKELPKIRCACGKVIKPTSMQIHVKSRKHITYLQNPNRFTITHEKIKVGFD